MLQVPASIREPQAGHSHAPPAAMLVRLCFVLLALSYASLSSAAIDSAQHAEPRRLQQFGWGDTDSGLASDLSVSGMKESQHAGSVKSDGSKSVKGKGKGKGGKGSVQGKGAVGDKRSKDVKGSSKSKGIKGSKGGNNVINDDIILCDEDNTCKLISTEKDANATFMISFFLHLYSLHLY